MLSTQPTRNNVRNNARVGVRVAIRVDVCVDVRDFRPCAQACENAHAYLLMPMMELRHLVTRQNITGSRQVAARTTTRAETM